MTVPRKVSPGEAITAELWNSLVDALRRATITPDHTLRMIDTPFGRVLGVVATDGKRWLVCKNTESTETAAAWGVARITGMTADVPEAPYLTIARPNNTIQRIYTVLYGQTIAAGGFGFCTFDWPARVLYGTGTPAYGESWGPDIDSWSLEKERQGFRILGAVDATTHTMQAVFEPIQLLIGKPDSTGNKTDYINVSIWWGKGSGAFDSGININGELKAAPIIDNSLFVAVTDVNSDWVVTPWEQ